MWLVRNNLFFVYLSYNLGMQFSIKNMLVELKKRRYRRKIKDIWIKKRKRKRKRERKKERNTNKERNIFHK